MDPISLGLAGAGLASSLAGSLFGGAPTRPAFDYTGANQELENYQKQLAAQNDYVNAQFAESERQKQAIAANRGVQIGLREGANTDSNDEQALYGDVPGQMATKEQSLADFFNDNSSSLPTSGPTAPNAMPVSTSAATLADAVGKNARVSAFNTQQNGALAGVRSCGDVMGDLGRSAATKSQDIGVKNNFRAGQQGLLPAVLQPAYQLAPPPTPTADFSQFYSQAQPGIGGTIAKGAGGIATAAGLSGFNPFGAPVGPDGQPTSGLGSITGTASNNAATAFGPVFVGF